MSLVAIGGIAATVLVAIVGWLIQRYRNKRKRKREEKSDMDNEVEKNTRRVSTLWKWAFGLPDDETDGGLAEEIQNGFNNVEEDINDMKKKQEMYHEVEMDHLERLVNELHDEDDLDIEREDILKDT